MAFLNGFEDTLVGTTAVTSFEFILQNSTNPTNFNAICELLDADGVVYSTGVATSLNTVPKGNDLLIQVGISLPIPEQVPVNEYGSNYQVAVTLLQNGEVLTTVYSTIKILSSVESEVDGPQDIVVLLPQASIASITLPYDLTITNDPNTTEIVAVLCKDSDPIDIPQLVVTKIRTDIGWRYSVIIDTQIPNILQAMPPHLDPYNLIWQYRTLDGYSNSQLASVYCINASIADAEKQIQAKVNKARANIKGAQYTFQPAEVLGYLRRGRDMFNGVGQSTSFTMINAKNAIRDYWLRYSEYEALISHALFEGETDFDYGGQQIQLTVNRAQYYNELADKLMNYLDQHVKPFKDLLAKRGNISGDGSVDPNNVNIRAVGQVGVTVSPVSKLGPYNRANWFNMFGSQYFLWR